MSVILIAGCGYVGSVLGSELVSRGHEVFGLRRDAGQLPDGIRPLEADLLTLETLGVIPQCVEHVVFAAAPALDAGAGSEQVEAAYRAIYLDGLGNLLRTLAEQGERPRRIFFTSSTSVYGQRRGEWVDEDTKAEPSRFSGEMMLMAEGLLRGSSFQTTCVRFGGIYGPGRTSLLDRVESGEARWRSGGPHYSNRIHRDDAAGMLCHLIQQASLRDLYLGVDCEPSEERILFEWLAEQLAAPAPSRVESQTTASRRGVGSKRCRNTRLLESGYSFRYPSFRDGYGDLIRQRRKLLESR